MVHDTNRKLIIKQILSDLDLKSDKNLYPIIEKICALVEIEIEIDRHRQDMKKLHDEIESNHQIEYYVEEKTRHLSLLEQFSRKLRSLFIDYCPECGSEMFMWKEGRLDCRKCSYKKY